MRRILDLYDHPPADGRVVFVDEFGLANLLPRKGEAWQFRGRPGRLRATYDRHHGVMHMFAALDLAIGTLGGSADRGPGQSRWPTLFVPAPARPEPASARRWVAGLDGPGDLGSMTAGAEAASRVQRSGGSGTNTPVCSVSDWSNGSAGGAAAVRCSPSRLAAPRDPHPPLIRRLSRPRAIRFSRCAIRPLARRYRHEGLFSSVERAISRRRRSAPQPLARRQSTSVYCEFHHSVRDKLPSRRGARTVMETNRRCSVRPWTPGAPWLSVARVYAARQASASVGSSYAAVVGVAHGLAVGKKSSTVAPWSAPVPCRCGGFS
jgi:hypothetical protein